MAKLEGVDLAEAEKPKKKKRQSEKKKAEPETEQATQIAPQPQLPLEINSWRPVEDQGAKRRKLNLAPPEP